jgi:hypothetical protein
MSGRRGLNLSAAQVIASVLATLSAAVAASFLGVAGTLLGAALGSVVSTMGTEIYKHYLQRSEERLRSAGQVLYHSAARTGTGNTNAQAEAASGGRHAAYQGAAGQQGVTRDLGNRDVAGQDPANQDTAVWDRRQYGTPRDSRETQTISGFGTEWAGAANGGGVSDGSSPNGGAANGWAANGGASNRWDGSGGSAGQHANGSITPEGADGDAGGHGSVWAAITSFFAGLTRRQWLTYGGIAAGLFIIVIAGIIVFQLAAGKPLLENSFSGHTSRQQQHTTHPSSTPSATPTGSTPASPTSSASQTSGTPTPASGTPTPSTSVGSTSPSAVPSATPTTGSSGAAQSKSATQAAPTP